MDHQIVFFPPYEEVNITDLCTKCHPFRNWWFTCKWPLQRPFHPIRLTKLLNYLDHNNIFSSSLSESSSLDMEVGPFQNPRNTPANILCHNSFYPLQNLSSKIEFMSNDTFQVQSKCNNFHQSPLPTPNYYQAHNSNSSPSSYNSKLQALKKQKKSQKNARKRA